MADETPENDAANETAPDDAAWTPPRLRPRTRRRRSTPSRPRRPWSCRPPTRKPRSPIPSTRCGQPPGGAADAAAERRSAGSRLAAPNRRKVREGIVVSDAMSSTVVVAVVERVRHPKYGKTVQRTKKLYVHDAEDSAKVGDRVRVQETRPLSKLKRWRLTEVVERAR